MEDSAVSTSKSSELGDPNPKPSKIPKTYPSYSPSKVCSEANYVYSLICGPVASSAMSDGKEIVGKDEDEDSAYKTSATTPINVPDGACSEADLIIYKLKSATIVLDYYNNKNDTQFELVEDETLASYPFCNGISGTFIHCVFNAKEDSSIKKFFAIIQYVSPSGPVVTTCKILEGDTKVDCELCRLAVPHVVVRDYVQDPPTYRPVPNFDGLEFRKRNRKKAFERVANRSLDHYNKINGTNFVVEEAETICCCTFSGDWIHCCFDAVDSSIKQFNHDDSPSKLFFAEIKYDTSSDPVVTNCKIVQGETKIGCENCKSVTHPVDGYRGSFLAASEIVEKSKKQRYQYYRVYCAEFVQAGY